MVSNLIPLSPEGSGRLFLSKGKSPRMKEGRWRRRISVGGKVPNTRGLGKVMGKGFRRVSFPSN